LVIEWGGSKGLKTFKNILIGFSGRQAVAQLIQVQ
jgi:hypothetical protein